MSYVSIETAQNVEIRFPKASFAERLVAYIIDMITISVVFFVLFIIMTISLGVAIREGQSTDASYDVVMAMLAFAFFLYLVYAPIMETIMKGQTIGKKIMKIRVMRLDGTQASVGNYFVRWLFGIFEFNFFMGIPAIIAIVSTKNGQRIGDMVAQTTVVKLSPAVTLDSLYIGSSSSETITYPGVNVLTERDIETIREVLASTRRGNMSPEKSVELLYATRDQVARVLNVPADVEPESFLTTVISDWTSVMGRTGPQP